MMRKVCTVIRTLLVAMLVLVGVPPALPAQAAVAHTAPRIEAEPDAPRTEPIGAESRHAGTDLGPIPEMGPDATTAATQAGEAIDPGAWDQQYPSAAGDSTGNTYVVWEDYREGWRSTHVRFSERPAGGDWQPSVKLDPPVPDHWQDGPQIAVDGSGNLFAIWRDVWMDGDDTKSQIVFAYRPVGGDWQTGAPISPSAEVQGDPSLAVNRRGIAVVAWTQGDWPTYHVFCAVRPVGGAWGAAEQVTEVAGNIPSTDVAIDDWGRVYVTWDDWTQSQNIFRERSPDGSWSAEERIEDSDDGGSYGTQIAVDGSGNVHAVWEDSRGEGSQIYAAYRPVGGLPTTAGTWSVNVRLDDGEGGVWSPGLSIDGAGNAVAAWSEMNTDVYGAVRYLGSGWTPGDLLVEAAASSSAALADERTTFPVGPQAIESWLPALALLGSAGTLLTVGPSKQGDTNVLAHNLETGGANGCGNVTTAAAAVSQALSPQAPAQGGADPCRGGNGSQEPTLNLDDGFIGPPEPDMAGPLDPLYGDLSSPFGMGEGSWPGAGGTGASGGLQQIIDPAGYASQLQQDANYYYSIGDIAMGDLLSAQSQTVATNMTWDPASQQFRSPLGYGPMTEFELLSSLGAFSPGQEEMILSNPEDFTELFQPFDRGLAAQATDGGFSVTAQDLQDAVDLVGNILEAAGMSNVYVEGALGYISAAITGYVWATEGSGAAAGQGGWVAETVLAALSEHAGSDTTTPDVHYNYGGEHWEPRQGGECIAEPVLPHSGEFVRTETPLFISGRGQDYALRLTYHSQLIYDGPVGWGWEHSYDRRIVSAGDGSLALKTGGGRLDVYTFDGTDYTSPPGRFTTIMSTTSGITITSRGRNRLGNVEGFYPLDGSATQGQLRSISDRNGNALRFAYDGQGHLVTVTDTLGRDITYSYDSNGRITTVTDFSGRAATLEYDASGDLVSITTPAVTGTSSGNDFPMGKTTVFSYTSGFDDLRLNHNLTTVILPNEVADDSLTPLTINTYGTEGLAFDRIVRQSWGGGRANASGIPAGGDVTLAYTTTIEADAPAGAASKTIVNDRGGNVIEFWHDGAGHRLRLRQVVDGEPLITDYTYNSDGQRTSVTYPAGNRIEYAYDEEAADRLAQGNLLERRRVADGDRGCDGPSTGSGQAAGGTPCPDLVTSYTYEPAFQQLQTVTDPLGNTTSHAYDSRGNRVQTTFPDVTVGPAAPQSASESWTYNAWGQPLTFTDAEGNVTRYDYYDTGSARGYRRRVIRDDDGLGLTTEYAYDNVGNVTSVTDPRGVRTEYEVNALNQVVKETRAAAVPAYGSYALRFTPYDDVTALDYETRYWYDANDNLVRIDVENVAPDLDADFHPTGTHSRDAENPWLTTAYTYDLLDNVVRVVEEVTASSHVTTERRYDPLENPISVTDPEGNRTAYTYDERNLVTEVTDGAESSETSTITTIYDTNGNAVRRIDGEGHATDFVHDGFDRRVGRVDALGNVALWRYDANGNLVESVLRDGQEGRNPGRAITATAPVTLTHVVNRFDERNRRYARQRAFFSADVDGGVITPITTDGDGDGWVETSTTFDRNGNVTAREDDGGHVTAYAHDGLDRLSQRTDALGNATAYVYDGNGNLVQTVAAERQPAGLVPDETFTTTNAYDAANRLIETTDNLGQTSRWAYDSRGNPVFTSDANGHVSGIANDHGNTALFAYDGLSRLTEETYHLREGGTGGGAVIGQVTMAYAYDDNDNLTRRTDPNGNVTAYAYDALDRLTGVTYADGTSEALSYDRAHNVVERIDANGSVIAHIYDGLNRRVRTDVSRESGVGGTTLQTFAWDGLSRLVAATDDNDPADPADDSELTFTYDSLSNRTGESQDGHTISCTYDGVGNRISLTYPSGTTLSYIYDDLNRVASVADGGTIASYDYVGPERPLRRANGNDTYTTFAYDGARRVTEVAHRRSSDDALLSGFAYTYDRVGNRTGETILPGGHATIYTYDSLNRLTGTQHPASRLQHPASSIQLPAFSIQYTYDAAGNRVLVTEDGASTAYAANQVHGYESVGGESRAHDDNGNLVWRQATISGACQALSVVEVEGPASTPVGVAATFTATASPSGASRPIAYTWRASGQAPQVHTGGGLSDTATFTWTVAGSQMVTVTAANACGEAGAGRSITVGEERWYVYLPLVLKGLGGVPARGHAPIVAGAVAPRAGDVVTETRVSYRYDFADRLLGVTEVVTVTDGDDVEVIGSAVRYTYDALERRTTWRADGETVRYLYDGGRVIEERDGGDALLATYVGDLTLDRGGSCWFYQADGLGSVRALADEAGAVVERVDYDPFGAPLFSGGGGESALGNPYLFRGRRYDGDVGLYVYGGRRYDPTTGRYVQRGFDGLTTGGAEALGNPYTFAGNNPFGNRR